MKRILVLAAAAAVAVPTLSAPSFAAAQSDPCRAEKRRQANTGTVVGALGGALLGGAVASRGAKTEGALLGGAVGAVAGHEVGKRRAKCAGYAPSRSTAPAPSRSVTRTSSAAPAPSNCRWVQEYYGGRNHSYEVCRGRDGVWRPSGRS